VAATAWLVPLAVLTWVQAGYWHDAGTVWEHALAVTSDNHRAHYNLGNVLADRGNALADRGWKASDPALLAGAKELLVRAREHYAQATALQRDDLRYHHNFGLLLLKQGELAAAGDEFEAVVRLNPRSEDAWYNLGLARLRTGQPARAEQALRSALALNPRAADSRAQLGTASWEQGRIGEAMAQWQAALGVNPREAEALTGLGRALLRRGQAKEAVDLLQRAADVDGAPPRRSLLGVAQGRLGLGSEAAKNHLLAVQVAQSQGLLFSRAAAADMALYRRRLAYALGQVGNSAASAREYAASLELEPGWPREAVRQAWRLATDPDPEARDPAEARELAEQVCQALAEPPPEALDAMAAAEAAAGKYADAATTARRALAKAPPALASAVAARLKLYEQGKPFVCEKANALR
jgi:tetratricopeptide (TPR) repeat protein